MPAHTVELARQNLVGWVTYWLRTNREGVDTAEKLAHKMGVSKSALTPFFKQGESRLPRLENLIALHNIVDTPIDVLLWVTPPVAPPRP
jgi:transcriptional regulator with XRE-family HTH domain